LLDIGNGQAPYQQQEGEFRVKVPDHLLLKGNSIRPLLDFVFPNLARHSRDGEWLATRAIICPTNSEVDEVNCKLLQSFPGEVHTYRSSDTILEDAHQYQAEILNRLTPSGTPPHQLQLKIGCCIMLLRNLDACQGHTNGSRYIVVSLQRHVIEARVAAGPHKGKILMIPRIPFVPLEGTFPFSFKRIQFPVRVAFAITSNKSQGQTLKTVGILLKRQFFSHGQLYVALSRVGDAAQVRIMTWADKDMMDNVVYKEVL
jgi:ATP-dependent DNA helicase PIF1